MPDLDPVARSTSDRGPAKWAAVGLLGGAALVALAWAALGRGPSAPHPTPSPQSSAPPSAPIIVLNVPPPITAPESSPAADPAPQGPAPQPAITVAPPPKPADPEPSSPQPGAPAAPKRINLNTAGLDELDLLPGVGKATAQAILDYRTKHGKFRTVSELDKVPGIGPSKLEKLRPLVTVD